MNWTVKNWFAQDIWILKVLANKDTLLQTHNFFVAHDASWAAQIGKHLLRTQNVSEQNQKNFLCPGHKICVRNKCCMHGQTGKHFCCQQCVCNNVFSFARDFAIGNCQYWNCYWVGCFVGLNRYCEQVPFSSPEFELNTRFASSNLTWNKGASERVGSNIIRIEKCIKGMNTRMSRGFQWEFLLWFPCKTIDVQEIIIDFHNYFFCFYAERESL